ncbi:hypothetical protein TD95_001157 [Thielaviopsis punctulata]|uniref:Small ribosomal subunit protein uS4m n=1 Tax=Thielaviopsis punctulata TaxID=72032 RepID=A0A0F4Z9W8_9PEZI|nr:hypothetical protein TD95_001157 [Thielaviopsis punctulata]
MRAAVKRYVIANPRLRQSWNKYNLYNLSKYSATIPRANRTFFQQKWQAKQALRSYHGEHVGEKRWTRLFSRRLMGAVEMPPEYLAAHDGSEQAAGRGSGLEPDPNNPMAHRTVTASDFSKIEQIRLAKEKQEEALAQNNRLVWPSAFVRNRQTRDRPGALLAKPIRKMTPYMHMTFAPMERRLDIAIFRAMFASSPRQARQFCIHGGVRVNGKKMRYGAYMLNPGDMFQVDPDKVMYATGKPKSKLQAAIFKKSKPAAKEEGEEADEAGEEEASAAAPAKAAQESTGSASQKSAVSDKKEWFILRRLLASAKALQTATDLSVKEKQELREFMKQARRAISRTRDVQEEDEMVQHLSTLIGRFKIRDMEVVKVESPSGTPGTAADGSDAVPAPRYEQPRVYNPFQQLPTVLQKRAEKLARENQLSLEEQKLLARILEDSSKNPVDHSKPYATPWQPRKHLAPFAFIPRYLEVNQNICAAVYLRHPVARRGMSEVPTPFPYEFSQLAFNWYLRRS